MENQTKPKQKTTICKNITLRLFRAPLTVSNGIKFLGLTFDSKLTWPQHISNFRQRMWLRINAIKAVSGRDLGMKSKTLVHHYKIWIRPIALYGALACYSATKTNLNKIQFIQNSSLKVALRRCIYKNPHRRPTVLEEGSLIPLKDEAVGSSLRHIERR